MIGVLEWDASLDQSVTGTIYATLLDIRMSVHGMEFKPPKGSMLDFLKGDEEE
jgi:hypothetical protein